MKVFYVLLSLTFASTSGDQASSTQSPDLGVPENIITNGYTAPEGKAPYIVFLAFRSRNRRSSCGGSVIGNTWVVTARHCTRPFNSVTIIYGSNRRGQGLVTHTVSGDNIINHPKDDIALIRTPHVNFTNRINKISLPSFSNRGNLYVNQQTTACGWGQTTSTRTPANLQCVDMPVISNAQCSSRIPNEFLCTSTSGGKSICFGDSGGPLVTQDPEILIGISSFGTGRRCEDGYPAGFTRVSSQLDWIRQLTGIAY